MLCRRVRDGRLGWVRLSCPGCPGSHTPEIPSAALFPLGEESDSHCCSSFPLLPLSPWFRSFPPVPTAHYGSRLLCSRYSMLVSAGKCLAGTEIHCAAIAIIYVSHTLLSSAARARLDRWTRSRCSAISVCKERVSHSSSS